MSIIKPPSPKTKTVAMLSIAEETVFVRFPEYRDDFRTLIKGLGFYWSHSNKRWQRKIGKLAGDPAHRCAETGHTLIEGGYCVEFANPDIENMMNLKTSLYDFQQRAVDKLLGLRVCGLFMEMGTGKTRVAIELAHLRRGRISNVVWFCPVSLKETIRYEIQKHTDTPDSAIAILDGKMPLYEPTTRWYIVGIESMSSSDRMVLANQSNHWP